MTNEHPMPATPFKTPVIAYFSVHGDPSLVLDVRRPSFSKVADVCTDPDDYGRAWCEYLAWAANNAPSLAAENARLRAALEFYADRANWKHLAPGNDFYHEADADGGAIARAALEAKW